MAGSAVLCNRAARVAEPYFRLPTQPKVLDGERAWGTVRVEVAQVEGGAAEQQTGEEAAEACSPLPTQWRVDEGNAL